MLAAPGVAEELAAQLAEANAKRQFVTLCGHSTKNQMAGPLRDADVTITTRCLNRVLKYDPRDLTVSVEAGISYRELSRILAEHRQMLPLDAPFSDESTIGGIVAANLSGPRRRLYGTARDLVIGMTVATLDGRLVRTGGMVVKNVAGLDIAKLMIGSFGTLAAIAIVNFRVHPMPAGSRSFVQQFDRIDNVMAARNRVLESRLQPAAIDILKTWNRYQLLVQALGSPAVLDRYSRELAGAQVLEGAEEATLWRSIRDRTPQFLAQHQKGAVLRVSCALAEVGAVLEFLPAPALARAGSGVCYGYFADASELSYSPVGQSVIEFAPQSLRESRELWPQPGSDFAMMKMIKQMLDPEGLLNRGRLYGRI
jgi:glycolate dehydrogenase FAD-binding subunit